MVTAFMMEDLRIEFLSDYEYFLNLVVVCFVITNAREKSGAVVGDVGGVSREAREGLN